MTALRCRAALLALCVAGAFQAVAAYDAVVKLRNSSLMVNASMMVAAPLDLDVAAALQFVWARGGVGLYERAEYTSAYITNDTLELMDGINPLDSFVTVEANNSYIKVNTSAFAYQALELLLVENNTLEVSDGADLDLSRSTLRLSKNNWFLVNESRVGLNTSRLNFTDFFSWWLQDSRLSARNAIVSLRNVMTWWSGSQVQLQNVTFDARSVRPRTPQRYDGKIAPTWYVSNSSVDAFSTSLTLENLPLVHLDSTTLSLSNATLRVRNCTVHFYTSSLDLNRSTIVAENSVLHFHAHSNTSALVSGTTALQNDTAVAAHPLVGFALGAVDVDLPAVDSLDIEF